MSKRAPRFCQACTAELEPFKIVCSACGVRYRFTVGFPAAEERGRELSRHRDHRAPGQRAKLGRDE